MAKPKKKPAPKTAVGARSAAPKKTAPVKAKKPAKVAAPAKKAVKPAKVAAPVKPVEVKPVGKVTEKKAEKKVKAADKGKNKKAKGMEEDDFLPEASEGVEELPDLSEFEETEEVVEESDDSVDLDDVEVLVPNSDEEVILTDAEGRRYCKVKDCDQIASVEGYCRFHYLLLWKKIQVRRKILIDGKLERYVEELTARYPDKFLEMIRRDLKTEKDFLSAIAELEIDENAIDNEFEDEAQNFIDEVRGVSEGGLSEEEEF